jgi:hypothetical protein
VQSFKIENFLRDNPGSIPPQCVSLTDDEVRALVDRLLAKAGHPDGPPQAILTHLFEDSTPVADLDPDQEEPNLGGVFDKCGIRPGPTVYVGWGPLSDIDRFQIEDLVRYFYDVWYPSADDIDIFDETCEWIVIVRHYGSVHVWRP